MTIFRQVKESIDLVSDTRWQKVGWWIRVGPKLAFYYVAIRLGFFAEDDDSE